MKYVRFAWCIALSTAILATCNFEHVQARKSTFKDAEKSVSSGQFDQWKDKGEVIDFKKIRPMFKSDIDAFNALINSGYDVIVDFYAAWCGPCKRMAPTFEAVARQFPDKLFVKIDIDAFERVASHTKVMSIPTVKYYNKDGTVLETTVGQKSAADLTKIIKKNYKDS